MQDVKINYRPSLLQVDILPVTNQDITQQKIMTYMPHFVLTMNPGNMNDTSCYLQYLMEYGPDYELNINPGNVKVFY